MFQQTKFDLHMMREIVRNVLCYGGKRYEYPHIEETCECMQNVYSDGYVIMKRTVSTVLQQLRHVILESHDNTVLSSEERHCTYATLVCNVLSHLNKYETLIWQKHTRHCNNFCSRNELKKFQESICDMKERIHALLPSHCAFVLQIVQNNIICIEKTGLLGRHAVHHVTQVIAEP